jgi:hypothetical protein
VARKAFHRKGAKKSRKERKENLADFSGSLCRGLLTARLFLVLPVGSAGFLFLLFVLNSSYSLVAHEVITSTAANAPSIGEEPGRSDVRYDSLGSESGKRPHG